MTMKEKFVLSGVPTGDMLEELFARFAALVGEQVRSGNVDGMVDQKESPLGRNRHCAAVQRRIAQCEGGASRVGRRYLLTQAALQAELLGEGQPDQAIKKGKAAPNALKESLREQLKRAR